jgi:site-specific DNA recombinase
MGRLTLNMLLSFAQFEREIAGERIRDKMQLRNARVWMGGNVPLGLCHVSGFCLLLCLPGDSPAKRIQCLSLASPRSKMASTCSV